jgi:hypothetical protein
MVLRLARFVRAVVGRRHFRLPVVLGVLGGVLLLASLLLPWFSVPDASGRPPTIVIREAPATWVFKTLCAVWLARLAWVRRSNAHPSTMARAAVLLLGIVLVYPHAVMVWCPDTAGKAAWLRTQHESLTTREGELWTSNEVKLTEWKDRVYLSNISEEAAVIHTPTLSPAAVPFGRLNDLLEWFGYSNSFCFFARRGWGLAIVGCSLLLLSLLYGARGPDPACILAVSSACGAFVATASAVCLFPAALCAWEVERSRDAAERGELACSLDRLEWAARLVPTIRENGDFANQLGLLQTRLGIQGPESSLYRAKVLEGEGRFEEADELFEAILRADHEGAVLRREAVRGRLRQGIRELNSGETSLAVQTLQAVLEADPCNLKVNFALQIASLRAARFDAIGELASRMRSVYAQINTINTLPVLGLVEENMTYAAYLRGDTAAAYTGWKILGDPKRLAKER